MPVILKTGRSINMNSTMHYVATGRYNFKHGNMNQPKPTAQKGIKYRNYLMGGRNSSGLYAPESLILPTGIKESNKQYKRGQKDNNWWLNQDRVKNQSVNLVMSFGHELDWRNPNDLMCGRWIVNHFLHLAFPTQSVFVGYQMDNAGRQSHVHLIINSIDQDKIKSDDHKSKFSNGRLYYCEEKVTKEWNRLHPEKQIKRFGELEREQNHLGRTQKRIITRARHLIPNVHRYATDFVYMNNHARRNGLVMNGYQHGEKLPLAELRYPERVDGYTLRLPKEQNRNLQSKPVKMGGSYLSEYIPGARVKDIKRDMNVNQRQAIDIENATIDLEQIHNASLNNTNSIIANSHSKIASASSSAFITSFKNHIKSGSVAQSLNHYIPLAQARTHNMQITTQHHQNIKQIRLQQRHQALDSLRANDIIRHSHLVPNRSFDAIFTTLSNLHHTFSNSFNSINSIISQNQSYQSQQNHQSRISSLQSEDNDFEFTMASNDERNSSQNEEQYNQMQINKVDQLYQRTINQQQRQMIRQQILNSLTASNNDSRAESQFNSFLASSSSSSATPFIAIPSNNLNNLHSAFSFTNSFTPISHTSTSIISNSVNQSNSILSSQLSINSLNSISSISNSSSHNQVNPINSIHSVNAVSNNSTDTVNSISNASNRFSNSSISNSSVSDNTVNKDNHQTVNSIGEGSDDLNVNSISNNANDNSGIGSNVSSNSSSQDDKLTSSQVSYIKFSNEMKAIRIKNEANDRKWNKINADAMAEHQKYEKKQAERLQQDPDYQMKNRIKKMDNQQAQNYTDRLLHQVQTVPRLNRYFNREIKNPQLKTYTKTLDDNDKHTPALIMHYINRSYQEKYGKQDANEVMKPKYKGYISKHQGQILNYADRLTKLGYRQIEANQMASVKVIDGYNVAKQNKIDANRKYALSDLKPFSYKDKSVDKITFRDESGTQINGISRPIMNKGIKQNFTVFKFEPKDKKVREAKDKLMNKVDNVVKNNQQNQKQVINKVIDNSNFKHDAGRGLVVAHLENHKYQSALRQHQKVVRDFNNRLKSWQNAYNERQRYMNRGMTW